MSRRERIMGKQAAQQFNQFFSRVAKNATGPGHPIDPSWRQPKEQSKEPQMSQHEMEDYENIRRIISEELGNAPVGPLAYYLREILNKR